MDELTVQAVWESVMPRPLNAWERAMLDHLLQEPRMPGQGALRRQIDHAYVVKKCGCGCLTTDLVVIEQEISRPLRVPIAEPRIVWEFGGHDTDGMWFDALVFIDDGYLSSLEVQRGDSSPFFHLPAPEGFLRSVDEGYERLWGE